MVGRLVLPLNAKHERVAVTAHAYRVLANAAQARSHLWRRCARLPPLVGRGAAL
jgi:hypothetical protein